jgi:cation diffusion facilitator family transporter
LINFLIKKFIKNYNDVQNHDVRESYSLLCGILGIICNLLLFGIKLLIGLFLSSIAITSDAFNNLSDIASSVVTLIGAKVSNRLPDKEHPFGHGRAEYISALITAFIIMIVGFELVKGSIYKIINYEKVTFNLLMIIILSFSVLIKVWMFSYNNRIGKVINSNILLVAAHDSLNDVYASSAVIISIIFGNYVNFPIDGIMGLIVSGLIIYAGFSIAKNTASMLLGTLPSKELVDKINQRILSTEGIIGVHDLIVHEYGPGRVMATVHAEVPDNVDIVKIHEVIDATEQAIFEEMGIHIVIHMDPISVNCERTEKNKIIVQNIVKEIDDKLSIHDFRMTDGENHVNLIFDLAVPYTIKPAERERIVKQITKKISEVDSRFHAVIQVDNAY